MTRWPQVPKAAGKASSERLPGWTFQRWDQDSAKMNLINLPMGESVVARKLSAQNGEHDCKNTASEPMSVETFARSWLAWAYVTRRLV